LDRGELDKIIERAAADIVGEVNPRQSAEREIGRERERERGYDERPRKKKSFWSEILDFD
jgi:Zn-finger nucleic acid-binding protein